MIEVFDLSRATDLDKQKLPIKTVNGVSPNSSGDVVVNDYVTKLSVSGKTITYTKKDGSTGTITTKDTTYSKASSAEAVAGTDDTKYMTPLRTKEAVEKFAPVTSVNGKTGAVTIKSFSVTYISQNTNLNSLTEFGEYVCESNKNAETLTNSPVSLAFSLSVRVGSGIQQELRVYDGTAVYIRNYRNWDSTWSEWRRVGGYFMNTSVITPISCDGSTVTFPYDGLAYVACYRASTSGGIASVYVDGVKIVDLTSNNYSHGYLSFPVKKGQTFNVSQSGLTYCYCVLISYS